MLNIDLELEQHKRGHLRAALETGEAQRCVAVGLS